MQEHLLYITELIINDLHLQKMRAVTAEWIEIENTASMSFYFDDQATEEEIEEAAIACVEIIAHCSNGLLEEHFIRWDYPKPLPEKFLAYKRKE